MLHLREVSWTLSKEELEEAFEVVIARGLSDEEVLKRQKTYGHNELPRERQFKPLLIFARQWIQPLTLLLVFAAIASMVIGEARDAIAIIVAAVVSVLAGLAQEGKTARVFDRVSATRTSETVVIRNGKRTVVYAYELVPGDVVILGGGDAVTADIRLCSEEDLTVNESALTGEWAPVTRIAETLPENTPAIERNNIVWAGTTVAGGSGIGVVIATGTRTQFGTIAEQAREGATSSTPLEKNVRQLAWKIALAAGAAILVLTILGILRGESFSTIVLIAIAIGVSVIPEGLPVAVTVVLAGAMERILRRGGLVKSLRAAETLGSTTVILTDKTGTLTEGRMALAGYMSAARLFHSEPVSVKDDSKEVLTAALLASEAFFDVREGEEVVVGRPVEQAVLRAARDAGITYENLEARGHKRISLLKFESKRRYAVSINEHPKDGGHLHFSGAPEVLLAASKKVSVFGEPRQFDKKTRKAFEDYQRQESATGRRLIGVAYVPTKHWRIPEKVQEGDLPDNLVFAGLLSLDDPVRADTPQMIKAARDAGVRVIMATGDYAETAHSIAQQAGIAEAGDSVITGADIELLSDEQLTEMLKTHHIFARVLPTQKLRLARLLREQGEVVAMTGDGVNDAPALAAADIGVAVGTGAAAAKDAADLVLLKNDFGVITAAIAEGRRAFANLRKTVMYLLSSGFSEIIVVGGALAAGGPLPILPAQILWANIIEEGIMAFPFAREPLSPEEGKVPSRTADERSLVPRSSMVLIASASAIVGVLLLALYVYLVRSGISHELMRSVMFIAMSLDPLFLLFSLKEPNVPIWKASFTSNPLLVISAVISVSALAATFFVPVLSSLLSLVSVPLFYVGLVVAGGIVSVIGIEIVKYVLREKRRA